MKNKLLGALLVLVFFGADAQNKVHRYMVFFTDKDTSAYNAANATSFLSERAIQRRQQQSIAIVPQDYPVTQSYVEGVASTGAEVYFKSRWFNAVLVQMNENLAATVLGLTYVNRVQYLAQGAVLSRTKSEVVIPEEFLEPPTISANSDFQLNLINGKQMHEDGYTGEGMLIAVFDNGFTGVNQYNPFQHVFDNNRLVASKDFVSNSGNVFQFGTHGTQVFSCIGARYKTDLVGTAPDASFVLCVTEETATEYRIEEYNWLLAAEFADSLGVDVINNSLGYSFGFNDKSMDYSLSDLDGETAVITQAANIASEKGMIVVTSAGNEGGSSNSWQKVTPPADARNILAIGAITKEGERSSFSSYGPTADGRLKPDVVTLGTGAAVMRATGAINTNNGTSFSSPQIAGFAACIWQANPDWDNLKVIEAIKNSGNNSLEPDTIFGYGVPNYSLAVSGKTLSIDQLLNTQLKVYPNPFKEGKLIIDFQGATINEPLEIEITDAQGRRIFRQRITNRNKPNELEVKFEASEAGIYFLSIHSRNLEKVIKLVKI